MAANFSIKAAIQAVDKATRPIKRVAAAVSGRLTLAFRGASRAAKRLNMATMAAVGGLARFGAAGMAAGAAGVIGLNKYIEKGDELAKLSRQLGLTVESLQEWRFAADRMGVGAELFDQSMAAFSKRLGEARTGSGALLKMLEKTGPVFKKQILNAESTEQALELYIGAMRKISDPTLKASLAAAAFSRAGMKLTRFADESAEGISALREEKRKLGVITTEQATATEEAADKMTNFKAALGGVAAEVGSAVLPFFIEATQALGDWIKAVRAGKGGPLIKALKAIGEAVRGVDFQPIVRGLTEVWNTVQPILSEIVAGIRQNFGTIKEITAVIIGAVATVFVGKWLIILNAFKAVAANIGTVWNGLKDVFSGIVDFVAGVFTLDAKRAIDGVGKIFSGFGDIFRGIWNGLVDFLKGIATSFGRLFDKLAPEPVKKAWQGLKGWFSSLWDGITSTFETAINKVMDWIDPLVQVVEDAIDGIDRITSFGQDKVTLGNILEVPAVGGGIGGGGIGSAVIPTATGAATLAGLAGSAARSSSEVTVSFKNAPDNMKVERTTTSGPTAVKTNVGRRVAGAGATL
jgi:hypothetical protein